MRGTERRVTVSEHHLSPPRAHHRDDRCYRTNKCSISVCSTLSLRWTQHNAAGPGPAGGGGVQTGTSPLFLVADSCLLFWDSARFLRGFPSGAYLSSLHGACAAFSHLRRKPWNAAPEAPPALAPRSPGLKTTEKLGVADGFLVFSESEPRRVPGQRSAGAEHLPH